jgi:hypothetical protein
MRFPSAGGPGVGRRVAGDSGMALAQFGCLLGDDVHSLKKVLDHIQGSREVGLGVCLNFVCGGVSEITEGVQDVCPVPCQNPEFNK